MGSDYAVRHCEITKLLILAALIPLSTAEVEQSFSLMKLICTKLRKRLTNENLTALMRICKYEGKINYKEIKELWLNADETKSKKDTSKADYVDIIIVLCILPSRNPFKKIHSHSLFLNCEFRKKFFMKIGNHLLNISGCKLA